MILRFNEREIDTAEYTMRFEEGIRAESGSTTFAEIMAAMDIADDEVAFSLQYGDDGLPENEYSTVDNSIFTWVADYNDRLLEPYNDKETNILLHDLGEEGLQLLYIYHHDLAADSDYNDEQFETLSYLLDRMKEEDLPYRETETLVNDYQDGRLRNDETYLLLKIRFTDPTV